MGRDEINFCAHLIPLQFLQSIHDYKADLHRFQDQYKNNLLFYNTFLFETFCCVGQERLNMIRPVFIKRGGDVVALIVEIKRKLLCV